MQLSEDEARALEYKLLKAHGAGAEWEPGGNRRLPVPGGARVGMRIQVSALWGNPHAGSVEVSGVSRERMSGLLLLLCSSGHAGTWCGR
jgi:hypothetical protein